MAAKTRVRSSRLAAYYRLVRCRHAFGLEPLVAAFVQRLRELGWTEGRTIAIEYRWAEGRTERYAEIAAEFVRLKVDVIVTVGSAVTTVKQATAAIPIVFAAAADPLGSGLVASLARPGGNVTGLSMQSTELVTKRCELLREILPDLRRMAVMGNAGYAAALLEMRDVTAAARSLGLEIDTAELRRAVFPWRRLPPARPRSRRRRGGAGRADRDR
jgi:putative ABC transport system substrate-binding protein